MGKQKLFGGFIATPCFGIDFGRFGGPVLYSFWGDLGVVLGHLIAGQGPSNNPLMLAGQPDSHRVERSPTKKVLSTLGLGGGGEPQS